MHKQIKINQQTYMYVLYIYIRNETHIINILFKNT